MRDVDDFEVQDVGDFGGGGGLVEGGVGAGEIDLETGEGFDADHVVGFEDGAFVGDGDAADEAVANFGSVGEAGEVDGEGPDDVSDIVGGVRMLQRETMTQ